MHKKNRIIFICVNYNSKDFTMKYIKSVLSLKRNENQHIEVLVVDNSEILSSELESFIGNNKCVSLLRCENNGYFSAINSGLSILNLKLYDFVCVGNNDLTFSPDFLQVLTSTNFDNNIFIVSPDIINKNGVHQNPHHLQKLSILKIFIFDLYFSNYYIAMFLFKLRSLFKRNKSNKKINTAMKINQGVGAFYILTNNFTSKFNTLFFPSFLYCEEASLSWQVHSFGGEILYYPHLEVYHHESASLSKFTKKSNYSHAKKSYWKIRKLLF